MDLNRLEYYFVLDVEVVAENFMYAYVQLHPKNEITPEDMVEYTISSMAKPEWLDHSHFMYEWFIDLAESILSEN